MPRIGVLRAGYACLGLGFAAMAASAYAGALLPVGFLLALVAAVLLVASRDDIPKYAGFALLGYFALALLVFLVATPITINKGGRFFVNGAPPAIANTIQQYLVLASPLVLGAAALLSAWEREHAARFLLLGAVGGFVLFGILSFVLTPNGADAAESQGSLLRNLFMVSALAGAGGALWAASRPDSYA